VLQCQSENAFDSNMRAFVSRSIITFTLTALIACVRLAAHAADNTVHEFRLDNGMRVLVKEDHRAPVVVSMVWYGVGSTDEHSGVTGVAHVLEHMMFKGTAKVPSGEFSKRVARAGGRDNAFTARDYTAYFQTLHRDRLPLVLEMEADRMANLALTKEEFEKEIKVVMEERRWRYEDRPHSLVYEALMATALRAHPYRHPTIGWMDDLQNMSVNDALDWYQRWYAPNNAILVIVGDVTGNEVSTLARKYFSGVRPRALPERKPQNEPQQAGERRVIVKAPAKLPYVLLAYRAPKLVDPDKDWEPYALEVLEHVLDGHDAARLTTRLVRGSRIATSAGAGYAGIGRGPGMFLLSATPSEGRDVAEVEAALKAEVQRVASEGVRDEELKRVIAQVVSSQVYERDSMFVQARQIGELESIGFSHRVNDTRLRRLREVTAEQVREVAQRYFLDDRLTVAVLDPQPLGEQSKPSAPAGLRH
jgi:zinc protease